MLIFHNINKVVMKTFTLLLMMFIGVGICAEAQVLKPGIGFNFTGISSESKDIKAKSGWQVGASVAFGEKFYVEPGLFYVGKTVKVTGLKDGLKDFKANFNGIRIPIAVGLNIIESTESALVVRGFAGGSAFFLTSMADNLNKSDFNTTSFGLFAGAGVDFSILFFELAYDWSATDLSDIATVDYGKTHGLYATAGLRLRL